MAAGVGPPGPDPPVGNGGTGNDMAAAGGALPAIGAHAVGWNGVSMPVDAVCWLSTRSVC